MALNLSCKKSSPEPELIVPENTKFCWTIRDYSNLGTIKMVCVKTAQASALTNY
jgi:hypothetical protein